MAYTSGKYFRQLLGGWDSSLTVIQRATALDLTLTEAVSRGAWKALLMSPAARARLFGDMAAMEVIAYSSQALADILNYPAASADMYAVANAAAQLESLVNDSNAFLLRSSYTSGSGNYTVHANGINALYLLAQASSGNAAGGTTSLSGGGASGGETVGYRYPSNSLPAASSTIAYSIGTVGANTTFGSQSATAGNSASGVTPGAAVGTTTNGGGASNLLNTSPGSAAWQKDSFRNIGAAGGLGNTTSSNGDPGLAGAAGAGGAGGISSSKGGGAGTGLGSGGGGGYGNANAAVAGGSAAANSGCGPGGGNRTSSGTSAAGTAGTGGAWAYAIKKR
ncbi:MAG: hypothetical protein ACAI44_37880 [Candidatus Sericytochromatia bacterium]